MRVQRALPRRQLVGRLGSVLLAWALLGVLVASSPVWPATIVVQGGCTLAHAILAANLDVAVGDCASGDGADTVVLTDNVVLDSVDNSTDGPNGLPSIVSPVTIVGEGINRSFEAGTPEFRIFHIAASGNLTLDDVDVSYGATDSDGGNIYNRGWLHVHGGAIHHGTAVGDGGGIFNHGFVDLNDTFVYRNDSIGGDGGAIANGADACTFPGLCWLYVTRTIFLRNRRAGSGGAIHNDSDGFLTLVDSVFDENEAVEQGGAVFNIGDLDIVGCGFYRNYVRATPESPPQGYGGGLYSGLFADVYIANSTFWSNSAEFGGAIYNFGTIDLDSSTLADNEATNPLAYAEIHNNGTTRLSRSIVHNRLRYLPCDPTVINQGNNFGCGSPAVTMLDDAVKNNGGRFWTLTLALLAGSSAIDAGGTCHRPEDQRRVPRGDPCDSGAFEFGECADVSLPEEGGTHIVTSYWERHESCEYVWVNDVRVVLGGRLRLEAGIFTRVDELQVDPGAELVIESSP